MKTKNQTKAGRRRGRNAGFTLMEVVIATVLFSIVLLAAGGMILTMAGGTKYSHTRTNSAFHMQRQIERFKTMDYTNLSSGTNDTTLPNGAILRAQWTVSQVVPGRLAQIDLDVVRIPAGPGGSKRSVRVFVHNRNLP